MLYCFRYWHPEKHGYDTYYVVAIVCIYQWCIAYNASKMVSESHPCLSLNSSLMLSLIFFLMILILNHACEHPIYLKLRLGVPYNSQNYAYKNIVTYNSQNYARTLGSGLLYSWFTPFLVTDHRQMCFGILSC